MIPGKGRVTKSNQNQIIVRYMEMNRMSRLAMAEKLGISYQYLWMILSARYVPSQKVKAKIEALQDEMSERGSCDE